MKVLIACEYSGRVRDAFIAQGHDAMSCDLLPTDVPGPHYHGPVEDVLYKGWDLMVCHPPCTDIAVSGARHFPAKMADGRQQKALDFVMYLMTAPIPRIALENPISIISSRIRKPGQVIQPWMFGHKESKATCLWLTGLPRLTPTNIVDPDEYGCRCGHRFQVSLGKYGCPNCNGEKGAAKFVYSNQTASGQNKLAPGPNRWKERSRTLPGIAQAMAAQWGNPAQLELAA